MTGMDASQMECRRLNGTTTTKTVVSLAIVLALWMIAGNAGAQQRRPAPRATNRPQPRTAAVPRRAAQPAPPDQEEAPQKLAVVAAVNNQQVTRQYLGQECMRRYGKEVLESMVNKHLIWQECQRRQITITQQDVEDEIGRMAGKFGLAVDRWLMMLEQERDISGDKYRRDIIWPTLALRRLAAKEIVVTEDEVRKAFESEYGPQVKVRLITVSQRAKADELRAKAVAKPADFGDLAKEFSEDTSSAAARGLVPPIRKHLGHELVEQAAFALQKGEISPVIPIADQYLILKCEGHVPETMHSSQDLARIQEQLHDQIRDTKLRDAAANVFQSLQQSAQVVNVFNDPSQRSQLPGIAATINGQPITLEQLAEECILRYGKEVLDGEINRIILMQALKQKNRTVDQRSIDEEIARAAEAYGVITQDGRPDVEAWLKSVTEADNVTVDLYVRDAVWPSVALKQLVNEQVEVTKEDLEKGFVANYGERVEVLAIVLGNQRLATKVWEMAQNNSTDDFFGELAQQYSIEPVSKANFGKVPPIRRYSGQPIVEEEAFRLQPGANSGILAVGDKFIILRCLGRTTPVVKEFATVESELSRDIHEKKLRLAMANEFDRLKETASIDNFLTKSSQSGTSARAVAPASFEGQRR